jgi:acyl-[acyl-carrier-protein]-phospholipid O-acyltransferase/long-chain-fatty-acid--[acyl-carrier-protein] ligase
MRHARAHGLSDLAIPASILVVDNLPVLGAGKTDYPATTALAAAAAVG